MITEEMQLPSIVQLDQSFQNKTPVQTGQNTHGEEEIFAAGYPLCSIRRQAAARYDHMYVGMVRHGGTPGMKHRRDANPGAEVLWVRRDLDYRVRARTHQQIVDLPFVLIRDVSNGFGQREDEVEIPHGQQLGLARRQPCLGSTGLAFGAMAITARIVGDVLVRTVFATRDMPAERRSAAAFDCTHHLQLVQVDMFSIGRTPGSAMVAEDIRNLQR